MDGTPSSPPPTSYGYLGAPSGKGVDSGTGQLLALPAFFITLDIHLPNSPLSPRIPFDLPTLRTQTSAATRISPQPNFGDTI